MELKSESRLHNTVKNVILGLAAQLGVLVFSLIGRAVFIRNIGVDYLGVSGLFGNILAMLSLAEFGIGNVMYYSLYKPVAENDEERIICLLDYYKKIYICIACIVFVVGISLLPFLELIIKTDLRFSELRLFYIIFVLNSMASYISAYKSALLNAAQKVYINKIINMFLQIIQNLTQIIIILFTHNFVLYLVVMIIFTYATNLITSFTVNRIFPFIKNKPKRKLNELHSIIENIKSSFLYQIGGTVMRSTDNILISAILGTRMVGYYSNYSMIITNITNYINILSNGLAGSLGNFNALADNKRSYDMFNVLLLIFHWIAAACSLSMLFVFSDWMSIWVGKKYIIDNWAMFMTVLDFYINIMLYPTWLYRESVGLFKQMKYIMLIAAGINIILSVIFGNIFGMAGIFAATIVSRVLTYFWYEPMVLYKKKFNKKVSNYWVKRLKYFAATLIAAILCYNVFRFFGVSFFWIILKGVTCFAVSGICFVLVSFRSKEFQVLWEKVSLRWMRFSTI